MSWTTSRADFNFVGMDEDHEQMKERAVGALLLEKEKIRKDNLLKISREQRVAVLSTGFAAACPSCW